MFVITFYSYKGGVGRTMALVNAATELTRRGRRVLIVDFDLEAPGISTYVPFAGSAKAPGIVEYVASYLATSKAPNVSEFIVPCEFVIDGEPHCIWTLPAGRGDDGYGTKLASIDWQDLYENKSGYLFFEDFKQQLQADDRRFDYVLVDSRTGYTDVGGICTRQLADVVILMFFPNEQNISGLRSITSEIRADKDAREHSVDLLFVPSNIPDLDDENGILKRMMDTAKDQLEYDEPAAVIHHYDSLSLVEQSIFTVSRPRSRLSEEYRSLVSAIIQLNMEDREGALSVLQRAKKYLENLSLRASSRALVAEAWLSKVLNNLDNIGRIHSSDGEVTWNLASVYQALGNLSNELNALNDALDAGYDTVKVRLRRAQNLMTQARQMEAKSDLNYVVSAEKVSAIDLMSAIEALRTIDPRWFISVESSPSLTALQPRDVLILADTLMIDTSSLPLAKRILRAALEKSPSVSTRFVLENQLVLVLIGIGDFRDAMDFIASDRDRLLEGDQPAPLFNYAMAEWGLRRTPSYDLIDRLIALDRKHDNEEIDANYFQCLAICYALRDQNDVASSYIEMAKRSLGPGKVFSSWRYRYVDRGVMMEDLKTMEANLSVEIAPAFLSHESHALH
ncbi:MAG: hypothetical protein E5V28_15885 [Mesorhizobium sp.]|nr:MAG: hypothetical protein E5V28_15885 [Mesorhizobium sp.]